MHNQHFVDYDEFYQDFLIPYGARYEMAGLVDQNHDQYSVFCPLRAVGQKPFEVAEQQAVQRFTGHLQRALRMQKHT